MLRYPLELALPVQVKSGVFASKDRDSALMTMIEAASVRYSPEQEAALLQRFQAASQAQAQQGLERWSASLLRRISLNSVSNNDDNNNKDSLGMPCREVGTPAGWFDDRGGCSAIQLFSSSMRMLLLGAHAAGWPRRVGCVKSSHSLHCC